MLNLKYIASNGTEYDLLTDDHFVTECNAFNYGFTPITFGKRYGSKVYGFEMPQKEINATLYAFGVDRKNFINELIAEFDKDVLAMTPGTLVCNGYSIPAYCISQEDCTVNTSNLLWDSFKRTFLCPYPFWSKQSFNKLFVTSATEPEWEDIKDYVPVSENGKADYMFDYMTHTGKNDSFTNEDLTGSEYVLVINGSASLPEIRIGDLTISMNLNILTDEFLTIDSRAKTIVLTHADGTTENAFGYRDVSVDIFQKIPKGEIYVYWDGDYSWTLTLYDERTAPLWN